MNSLWTEKYRPSSLDSLDAPEHIKRFLSHAIEHGCPHLLLYGPPGTGKTTVAGLLGPSFSLNASDERGIDTVRGTVKRIANTVARQIIVLDECENFTRDAQTCLRRILEDYPNTTFIFCTNYAGKIIAPLRSRLLKLRFRPGNGEALAAVGKAEGLDFEECVYSELFAKCNGDLRRCINILQGVKPLLSEKTETSALLEEAAGLVPLVIIEEFYSLTALTYTKFVNDFVRAGFSVLQLVYQLNDGLRGNEKQKCLLAQALARAEESCVVGCADELVLMSLCISSINK